MAWRGVGWSCASRWASRPSASTSRTAPWPIGWPRWAWPSSASTTTEPAIPAARRHDPDRLESWLASLTTATDFLTGTGVGAVGMVGIRMGALMAASEAVRREGIDALVLWDPCLSGRSFLREQRFLRLLATEGEEEEDAAVEAPGIRFEAKTVKDLSDLDMTGTPGVLGRRTLVLVPPGRSHPRQLEARLAGAPVEWQEATGQEDLLDSQLQETPFETIERVALWLSEVLDATPVSVAPPQRGPAVVARAPMASPSSNDR